MGGGENFSEANNFFLRSCLCKQLIFLFSGRIFLQIIFSCLQTIYFGVFAFVDNLFFQDFSFTKKKKKKIERSIPYGRQGTLGCRDRETLWGLSRELDVKRRADREPIK